VTYDSAIHLQGRHAGILGVSVRLVNDGMTNVIYSEARSRSSFSFVLVRHGEGNAGFWTRKTSLACLLGNLYDQLAGEEALRFML
jgi:hypothetical protein